MRIALITGDHPRHLFFARALAEVSDELTLFLEKREAFIPAVPEGISDRDRRNFKKHFENRAHYEKQYFGEKRSLPNVPCTYVDGDNIREAVKHISQTDPDYIFVFGTLALAQKIQSVYKGHVKWINLNTGLMQRYRGDATLFWPFYFMEPQWAGATFHLLEEDADEAVVIHQCVPFLEAGDSIHEVACKVVIASADALSKLIVFLHSTGIDRLPRTVLRGKVFVNSDFRVEHLRVIYELFDDDMVDDYLEKRLKYEKVALITL